MNCVRLHAGHGLTDGLEKIRTVCESSDNKAERLAATPLNQSRE